MVLRAASFLRMSGLAAWVAACLIAATPASRGREAGGQSASIADLAAGAYAWRKGYLVEATRRWDEAIRLCRLDGDQRTEMDVLAQRGEAMTAMGQASQAEADLKAALDRATRLADAREQAALQGALGNLAFQKRRFPEAQDWLTQSIETAKRAGADEVVAASLNNMGNVVAAEGDPVRADKDYYRQAAAAADAAGEAQLRATVEVNRARAHAALGDRPGADAHLAAAVRDVTGMTLSRDRVIAVAAITRAALEAHKAERGGLGRTTVPGLEQIVRRANEDAKQLDSPRELSLAEGTLGELLAASGRDVEAAAAARNAIWEAQRAGAPDLLWRWEWLNGRLAVTAGDRHRATEAYRRAEQTLEQVRPEIPVSYTKGVSSYRQEVGELYFRLVDLLIDEADRGRGGGADEAYRQSIRVVDQFESSEVSNFYGSPCFRPAVQPSAPTKPRPDEAILYPIIRPDRIEVIAQLPDGTFRHHATSVAEVRAERVVQEFYDLVRSGSDFNGASQQLYDWILRPFDRELDQVKTLVIVPDGALRKVPFGVLRGDDRKFIIERMAVVTVPSTELAEVGHREAITGRALLAGTSIQKPGSKFEGLADVPKELEAIQKQVDRAEILLDTNFTGANLRRKLTTEPFSIVHLASHAKFGGALKDSFLETYDGQFSLEDLQTSLRAKPARTQLLVLSACDTAQGNDLAVLGLAGVAVKAGARGAIGSLWEVDDRAAAALMPKLYEHLKRGIARPEALRLAQVDMLDHPDADHREFSAPKYWGAFLFIGAD